jgi:hypothetical protein
MVKCRIRYQSTIWMAFDSPDPLPWKLDIPANLMLGKRYIWPFQAYASFQEAVDAFQYLLRMKKRGWLHR